MEKVWMNRLAGRKGQNQVLKSKQTIGLYQGILGACPIAPTSRDSFDLKIYQYSITRPCVFE